jgi:hypothetical protein
MRRKTLAATLKNTELLRILESAQRSDQACRERALGRCWNCSTASSLHDLQALVRKRKHFCATAIPHEIGRGIRSRTRLIELFWRVEQEGCSDQQQTPLMASSSWFRAWTKILGLNIAMLL